MWDFKKMHQKGNYPKKKQKRTRDVEEEHNIDNAYEPADEEHAKRVKWTGSEHQTLEEEGSVEHGQQTNSDSDSVDEPILEKV